MIKKFIIATILSGLTLSPAVFAENETTTEPVATTTAPVTTATPTVKKVSPKQADLVCMQTAVEKRDTAIVSAWDKLTPAIKTALETRKSALKSAWSNTDKKARGEVIKKAWNAYRQVVQSARKAFNNNRKAVWKQFNVERKNCGGLSEDATTEAVDNQL